MFKHGIIPTIKLLLRQGTGMTNISEFNKYISTKNLTKSDLPIYGASWDEIIVFASTFDTEKEFDESEKTKGLQEIDGSSSILKIRMTLHLEWRRYNHFGRRPDSFIHNKAWDAIEFLREQLSVGE